MNTPIYLWRFASSSGTGKYETLKYNDNTLSCDCPGWTRRCVNGVRSCKHTRFVETGAAESEAISHGPVGGAATPAPVPVTTTPTKKPKQSVFSRKFV